MHLTKSARTDALNNMRKGKTEVFIDDSQVRALADDLWYGEILHSKKKGDYYYVSLAKVDTQVPALLEFAEKHGLNPKDHRTLKRFMEVKKIIREGY